ncbi:MAG: hypothetical protein A2001_08000 [Treponema sp. GWC1_61_84]|nr:MAG: hypothetical protein A2001_08000 [Treponema sp. GWC1_61_84]
MRTLAWIPFTALRYLAVRRRDKSTPSSLLAVLGIATGVMSLTIVLSVMNGFQLGFIESILEISSYHVRVEGSDSPVPDEGLVRELSALPGTASVVPFLDVQTIIRGGKRSQAGCLLRGLPPEVRELDPGFSAQLEIETGSFDLVGKRSVVLGAELARNIGAGVGDTVVFLAFAGNALDSLSPEDAAFTVTGTFRSGFYEYDLGWAFTSLADASDLYGEPVPWAYGVKLRDRWRDEAAVAAMGRATGARNLRATSWRVYNRAFFGALRTEKLVMFGLVALIFVVVALNIFQAQRRSVLERRDEIGLLRAVGASPFAVRLVFVIDGLAIGLAGATAGMIPGLAVASDISLFFSAIEFVANSFISAGNFVTGLAAGGAVRGTESFRIFSPAVFYIREIPSRVVPLEAAAIYAFGFLSATAASWLASGRASRVRPAEVLRDE